MAKKAVDLETKTVSFTFGEGIEPVLFELAKCSPEMITQLALHGFSQKGGDSYASAKSQTEGTEIDPAEWSRAQVAGVVEQVLNDDWTVRTPGSAQATDLATALAEAVDCEVADAIERLADADKDEKAALRKHPDIAAILARIKVERATAKAAIAAAKAGTGEDLSEYMNG